MQGKNGVAHWKAKLDGFQQGAQWFSQEPGTFSLLFSIESNSPRKRACVAILCFAERMFILEIDSK